MKFKEGDIVKIKDKRYKNILAVVCHNHVIDNKRTLKTTNNRIIHASSSGKDIKLATDREKFLYYTHGSFVLSGDCNLYGFGETDYLCLVSNRSERINEMKSVLPMLIAIPLIPLLAVITTIDCIFEEVKDILEYHRGKK